MKSSAIARIVLYSLIFVLLFGLMLAGMGKGQFVFHLGTGSGTVLEQGAGSVAAEAVSALDIDWAAGSVTVQTGDTDVITFQESGSFSKDQAMCYSVKNGVLQLSYSQAAVQIGFASAPKKDLLVTVPTHWICKKLSLDGASLDVELTDLTVKTLDIDGASCSINYVGSLDRLECDGASTDLTLVCTNRPEEMELDGMSCKLNLTLPADCGFELEMEGLSCEFDSDLNYTHRDEEYRYGDGHCEISVDGMSCKVEIGSN